MTVLVIGASGGTGVRLVEQLLARGETVRALARHATRLAPRAGLERVDADVLDPAALRTAMEGVAAVILAIGPGEDTPGDLCSRGTRHVLEAMRAQGVERLVCITGAMIGLGPSELGWLYRTIQARVPAAALEDRRRQESLVKESGLAWTLVRPTRLTNGPTTGALVEGRFVVGAMARVSRGDVAAFVVDSLARADRVGTAHTLSRRAWLALHA